MRGHLTVHEIESYRKNTLSSADVVSVCDHLSECSVCRAEMGSSSALDGLVQSFVAESSPGLEDLHPSIEHLARYVDRSIEPADREIVESHLETCDECRLQVTDIDDLRFEVSKPAVVGPQFLSSTSRPVWIAQIAAGVVILVLAGFAVLTWNRVNTVQLALSNRDARVEKLESELAGTKAELEQARSNGFAFDSDNPVLAVSLNDGGRRVGLDQSGEVVGIDTISSSLKDLMRRALKGTGTITPQWLTDLTARDGPMMGGDGQETFSIFEPVSVVVTTDRPTFKWQALAGASSYRCLISDQNFNQVSVSEEITTPEWRPRRPLPRGAFYVWEVRAIKAGKEVVAPVPPAQPGRFRVLEASRWNEISRALKEHPTSHLLLGLLYADAGLIKEAERHLAALSQANPSNKVAERLLAEVRSRKK